MNSFICCLRKYNISNLALAKRCYRSSSSRSGNADIKSGGGAKLKITSFETEITTLESGYRIASRNRTGNRCTIGVVIDSGARYEYGFPPGLSHIIEKLGFTVTKNFPERGEIFEILEQYGGAWSSEISRESTLYAVSAQTRGLEKIMHLLADVVKRPLINDENLDIARLVSKYEWENMQQIQDNDTMLLEKIHAAAWTNSTLGLPRYCAPTKLEHITKDHILSYMKTYFRPERMVVTGIGVDHQVLVDLTKIFFQSSLSTWEIDQFEIIGPTEPDQSIAKYIGTYIKEEKDFDQFNCGPNLAYVAIGMESVTYHDNDFIPSLILNTMMGGGQSFDGTRGPEERIYSRLDLNVLNKYGWIYSATAYNYTYDDSGLFCISGSSAPEDLPDLVDVLLEELAGMSAPITEEEFMRSKTKLKSNFLLSLESEAQPNVFEVEFIGDQILHHNQYLTPEEYVNLLDKVEIKDMRHLTTRLLGSKLCVAAMGRNLEELPSLEEITDDLAAYTKRIIK